jgi:hypothetical protein
MSASANTIWGDLPPSSSVTPAWWSAAAFWMSAPTSGEPVSDEIDVAVTGELGAGFGADPAHHIENALRDAGLDRQFGEAKHRQAGVFGRLDDDRVSHRKRGAGDAAEHLRRRIPRQDRTDDSMRFVQRQSGEPDDCRYRAAQQLVDAGPVEFQIAGENADVEARRLDDLADVFGFKGRQRFRLGRDQFGKAHQDAAALQRRHPPPPSGLESLAGAAHG